MEPACKILIFRLFSHCFNDVVNLNNIIALSDDLKIGYFVGLAVKFACDAGVVSTGAFGSAARRRYGQIKVINLIKRQSKMCVTEKTKAAALPQQPLYLIQVLLYLRSVVVVIIIVSF